MTAAKVRACPVCAVTIVKETGCNRIHCPTCETYFCYLCLEPLDRVGYRHYCRHERSTTVNGEQVCDKCHKCPLFTPHEETKEWQRVKDVATDELNRIWQDLLLSPLASSEHDEEEARIRLLDENVVALLQDPKELDTNLDT